MNFKISYEITEDMKKKKNIHDQIYANFCVAYVNQIKHKLGFVMEETKELKQSYDKNKKLVKKNVPVYKCSMKMIDVRKYIETKKDFNKKNLKKSNKAISDEKTKGEV